MKDAQWNTIAEEILYKKGLHTAGLFLIQFRFRLSFAVFEA